MGGPTSKDIAWAVLLPLPLVVASTVARFWIRLQRKTWGPDDWAMLANMPFWIISVVSLIGMSWSGVGQNDATLSAKRRANALRWFYVFQEFWCFTLITIKWSIGFTLIRIANKQRWIEGIIFLCLGTVTLVMGGTGMYLFFQCLPVEKNWHPDAPGECQDRNIQTILSFCVAAVSIASDWIFATLPAFLLWNIQMDFRVKLSVVALLGLGVFASIAPIVRLKYLIGLNDPDRLVQNLGIILAWAAAEVMIGMLVANLPACRPLLEAFLSKVTSRVTTHDKSDKYAANTGTGGSQYLELGERSTSKKNFGAKGSGIETKIYGRDLDEISNDSLPDDGSQRRIVASTDMGAIRVQREFGMEVSGHRA